MDERAPYTAIVLAAQRAGALDPLAARAGVSHKCLVPIDGKPLIVHVLEALEAYAAPVKVRISVEPELHGPLRELLSPHVQRGMAIEPVASSGNIADSVLAAAQDQISPYLITTADNVLLSGQAIGATLQALEGADVVASLASKASVLAVHPDAQRRFYEFRDGGYANCNLYGIAGPHAFATADVFREGGQFMKNPQRLVRAFGLGAILLFRFKLLTLARAMQLFSRRFGLKFRAVVPGDGSQAVDVDNDRTFAIAEMVLKARRAAAPADGDGLDSGRPPPIMMRCYPNT